MAAIEAGAREPPEERPIAANDMVQHQLDSLLSMPQPAVVDSIRVDTPPPQAVEEPQPAEEPKSAKSTAPKKLNRLRMVAWFLGKGKPVQPNAEVCKHFYCCGMS